MKLKIYKEKAEDKVVMLKLEEYDDRVYVVACDTDGKSLIGGCLITFLKDGTIRLNPSIDEDIGFKLDDKGRIKITE